MRAEHDFALCIKIPSGLGQAGNVDMKHGVSRQKISAERVMTSFVRTR
jgi:hypothetical protein